MKGISHALLAALLFGISTPLAKLLTGAMHPLVLAGLLYTGSGIGLALTLLVRRVSRRQSAPIAWPSRTDWPVFAGAVLSGGVIAPVLLMSGLQHTPASVTSLMLNLESVFTALLAWFVFREHFDRRIALGMLCIVVGSLVLFWTPGLPTPFSFSAMLIAAACLCWGLDNNLTGKVSSSDALILTCIKGLVAGAVNLTLAWMLDLQLPVWGAAVGGALAVGFLGYGISLILFVLALRHLGAARTGAYFAVAPFVGTCIAVLFQHEPITAQLLIATVLMAYGLWLHLSEHHAHDHVHEWLEHEHAHTHDLHHQHRHESAWDGTQPHSHLHRHTGMAHSHPHYPDIHHQHNHRP